MCNSSLKLELYLLIIAFLGRNGNKNLGIFSASVISVVILCIVFLLVLSRIHMLSKHSHISLFPKLTGNLTTAMSAQIQSDTHNNAETFNLSKGEEFDVSNQDFDSH